MQGLGAALMGILPFVLEHAVRTAQVASDNVVAGLLYLVAMAVAAGMTQAAHSRNAIEVY